FPLALAAGLVVLLLAIGTLAYVLLDRDDGSGGGSGGANGSATGGSSGASGGGDTGGKAGGPSDGGGPSDSATGDGGGTPGGGGGHTTTPVQTVRVSAHAVRGSYSGPCPPPAAQAPAFTATITVGHTPAKVRFRWVLDEGKPSDPGWRTLDFTAGGPRSRTVGTTETGYEQGATRHDRIAVEVDGPVEARSNPVAYSVTCDVVTPTSGATTGSPEDRA
ncbi:serine/threonine protein kinase, partial [Streptomyces sp. SID5785]|nr:serine/threonine protein kinase [Streptomyces sp. SID5785]